MAMRHEAVIAAAAASRVHVSVSQSLAVLGNLEFELLDLDILDRTCQAAFPLLAFSIVCTHGDLL